MFGVRLMRLNPIVKIKGEFEAHDRERDTKIHVMFYQFLNDTSGKVREKAVKIVHTRCTI